MPADSPPLPRRLLAAAVVLICVLCVHTAVGLSDAPDSDDNTTPPPLLSVIRGSTHRVVRSAPPHSAPAPTPALLAAEPAIVSVTGCASSSANSTSGCNLSSTLTIAGSNFTGTTSLEIAYQVRCPVSPSSVQSDSRIVTPLCRYYFPQDTPFDVRLLGNGTASANLTSAIAFHGTGPYVSQISTTTCTASGCNPALNNTFTVQGRNFLSPPAPPVQLYFYLGADYGYKACQTTTLSIGRFVCRLAAFDWGGRVAPPASTKFGAIAAVLNANWLGQEMQSDFLPSVVSFTAIAAASSSTGGTQPTNPLPTITRVSGCEDAADGTTRNCPASYPLPIPLRLIGTRFTAFLDSLSMWVADQPCPIVQPVNRQWVECSWDTSDVNYAAVKTTPLTVALNTSAGWVNVTGGVSLNDRFGEPVIVAISGCSSTPFDPLRTAGCDGSRTLTLTGDAFARYLHPVLILSYPPVTSTVDCTYPLSNPLTIECRLQNARLDGLPRNTFIWAALSLGGVRLSEAVQYVSLAPYVPPVVPSSSGGGGGGGGDVSHADELVGMKLALLSLMVVSLTALLVAVCVWAAGWWLAHRRSFVSQHGQAAVDSREVLLQ